MQHDRVELGRLGPRLAIRQMCILLGFASLASARGAHDAPGEAAARQEGGERGHPAGHEKFFYAYKYMIPTTTWYLQA